MHDFCNSSYICNANEWFIKEENVCSSLVERSSSFHFNMNLEHACLTGKLDLQVGIQVERRKLEKFIGNGMDTCAYMRACRYTSVHIEANAHKSLVKICKRIKKALKVWKDECYLDVIIFK